MEKPLPRRSASLRMRSARGPAPSTIRRRLKASPPIKWPRRIRRKMSSRNAKRSEEHTSELQSLMRISYAVFCLKKKNKTQNKKLNNEIQQFTQRYSNYKKQQPNTTKQDN